MSAKLSKISNASCWVLACRLFADEGPLLESALSDTERGVLAALGEIRAVKPHKVDLRYVLCPYCQLQRGQVVQSAEGLACECLECGVVPVEEIDLRAWMFDHEWLIRKLRAALAISPQDATIAITRDIWRLGLYQRRQVFLARNLDAVLHHPSVIARARSTAMPWLITPKPMCDIDADPLPGSATWLPLEERFTLYGGNLGIFDPAATEVAITDMTQATHGPFSEDFRWVQLSDSPRIPIALSQGQAAVFRSLWHFAGVPQEAYTIMSRAGLTSDKPIDVFKVKARNKGDPKYEKPLHAYQLLVQTDRRAGTYCMACAAPMPA